MTLGERLTKFLETHQLQQKDWAAFVRRTGKTVHNWATGKTKCPWETQLLIDVIEKEARRGRTTVKTVLATMKNRRVA